MRARAFAMTQSKQPGRGPKPPDGTDSKPAFGSKPFAALSSLSSKLPTLVTPPEAREPSAEPAQHSPLGRALSGRVVISRESKGRAGKTVVFARGIDGSAALLEALAKDLRHELGTNVRVEDGALVVQGALSERLAASLKKRGAARIVLGN